MARSRLVVENATAEEIHKLLRKDEKYMVGVRLYAVYQVSRGAASRDLEKMYNVSFKSVCNWVHQFNKFGLDGLKDIHRSGRKPRLSKDEMIELKSVIMTEEPIKYNYNTSTWTGPLIIDFIEKKYGIKYKKAQIYNVLKTMGLSYQKGKGIYPEADKEKRDEFIRTLKKTKKSNKQ